MSAATCSIYPYTHPNGYVQDYGPLAALPAPDFAVRPEQSLPAPAQTYQEPVGQASNTRRAALIEAKELADFVHEETAAGVDDGYTEAELRPYVLDLVKAASQVEKQFGLKKARSLLSKLLRSAKEEPR